ERQLAVARRLLEGLERRQGHPLLLAEPALDLSGLAGDRRMVEQGAQRQVHAEGAAHPRQQARGEERMTSLSEKVGVHVAAGAAQHVRPEAGEDLLDALARRRAGRRAAVPVPW